MTAPCDTFRLYRQISSFAFVGGGYVGFWAFSALLSLLVSLITLVAWVVLMIFAYQGKKYEVPVAAGIAKNIAGSV